MTVLAFSLGPYEIIAIVAVALLLFGTRLPMVGRSLGSAIVQFRRAIKGDEEPSAGDPSSLPNPGSSRTDVKNGT
jgi:TatA/E family protein of Tat protein translocase